MWHPDTIVNLLDYLSVRDIYAVMRTCHAGSYLRKFIRAIDESVFDGESIVVRFCGYAYVNYTTGTRRESGEYALTDKHMGKTIRVKVQNGRKDYSFNLLVRLYAPFAIFGFDVCAFHRMLSVHYLALLNTHHYAFGRTTSQWEIIDQAYCAVREGLAADSALLTFMHARDYKLYKIKFVRGCDCPH